MKRLFLLVMSLLLWQIAVRAQNAIAPAPEDKAVVYFVRASGLGVLINFTYFDSAQVIGRFNGLKYLRYECEPGEHLFWARSENRDFITAELEAGKIYIVEVLPRMGALKASVKLEPVNDKAYKLKKIHKLLAKKPSEHFTNEALVAMQQEMQEVVARGMEKLATLSRNEFLRLGSVFFQPDELLAKPK